MLLAVFPAHADVGIGADARLAGMGGAGLAVPDIQECQENPAFMAYCRSLIGIQMPSLSGQLDGISLNQLTNNIHSNMSSSQAETLAEDVGKQPVTLGAGLNAGIYLFDLNLSGSATFQGKVNPSPTFANWVAAGADPTQLQSILTGPNYGDFQKTSVEAGAVIYAPSVTGGFKVPQKFMPFGELAVGLRLKYAEEYYSKYTMDIANGELEAAENGNYYSDSKSVAADIGFLFAPKALPNTRVALVVNNAVAPQAVTWLGGSEQLAPTSVSIGVAQQVFPSLLVALDAVDLNNDAQVRAGIEWKTPFWLAVRAGYSSGGFGVNGGPTIGIGISNFCISYSQAAPITLAQSITF